MIKQYDNSKLHYIFHKFPLIGSYYKIPHNLSSGPFWWNANYLPWLCISVSQILCNITQYIYETKILYIYRILCIIKGYNWHYMFMNQWLTSDFDQWQHTTRPITSNRLILCCHLVRPFVVRPSLMVLFVRPCPPNQLTSDDDDHEMYILAWGWKWVNTS